MEREEVVMRVCAYVLRVGDFRANHVHHHVHDDE